MVKPSDKSIGPAKRSDIADFLKKYPDIGLFTPQFKKSDLSPESLFIMWQSEELPDDVESLEDAVKSMSKFGEHTRQLIAMGHLNLMKKIFEDVLKKSLLMKLSSHRFVVDHFIPLERQIRKDGVRHKLMRKLEQLGVTKQDMKPFVVTPIQSLPPIPLPKTGVRVEIVAVTMQMSGAQHVAVKKDGKLYSVIMDNWAVRQIFSPLDELYHQEKRKADVVLYPDEWSGATVGGYNFVDPDTGKELRPTPDEDEEREVTQEEYNQMVEEEAKRLGVPKSTIEIWGVRIVPDKPKDKKPSKQKKLGEKK